MTKCNEWRELINLLIIKNFKSIKEAQLSCKRINLFIGEPNTGKSNLLESIALLSYIYTMEEAKEILKTLYEWSIS